MMHEKTCSDGSTESWVDSRPWLRVVHWSRPRARRPANDQVASRANRQQQNQSANQKEHRVPLTVQSSGVGLRMTDTTHAPVEWGPVAGACDQ